MGALRKVTLLNLSTYRPSTAISPVNAITTGANIGDDGIGHQP
jgi:hypothetical protein